ncbi:Retrovirus-related Pol polyprotein from transposon 17.6-like protein, partial [Dinothrombium tinctorium]
MIGNYSNETISIPKNIKLGYVEIMQDDSEILSLKLGYVKKSMICKKKQNLDDINSYSYKDVKINSKLREIEQMRAKDLLEKYADVFSTRHDDLGYCNIDKHKIETENNDPIKKKPYKMSLLHEKILKQIVNDFLKAGLISPSKSNWSSPAILVAKPSLKNASDVSQPQHYRLVIDYRFLNNITKADVYPLPLMQSSIEKFAGKKFYSKFDITMGFYQIALDNKSKEKTAFITPFGLYQFNVLPMGMKNSPGTFQRVMNKIIEPLQQQDECVGAYVDDVGAASNDFNSHEILLENLFKAVREANIKMKPTKSEIFMESISYLGHILSKNGIEPDPKKIEMIDKIVEPINKKQLQSFVGTINFYRKFIPNFSIIARPLFDLMKNNTKFEWKEAHLSAFNYLKEKLKEKPILTVFNPQYEIEVRCDACDEGMGAVLVQFEPDGQKVIQYASSSFKDYQKKWHITHKEFYALYWSITKEFSSYLYGKKFTVQTDSKSITYFRTSKTMNPRLIRMITELEIFDFEIKYKSGKENSDADMLS